MKLSLNRRIVAIRGQLFCIVVTALLLVSFLPQLQVNADQGSWWDTSWMYRKQITIDHTRVAANLTSFPVLIDIVDSDLAAHAQSNGYDIVFTDANGNKLNHEVERYNSSNGHLTAWVRVPSLSSTVDTVLYMYYGNPSASNQQNKTGVWDSNFVMVQHFIETSGTQYDSTANGNNAVPSGGVSEGVAGKIGDADSFDGVNDYLYCANSASLNPTTVTLEAWINPDTVSNPHPIIEKYDWVSGYGGYLLRENNTNVRFSTPIGLTGHPVQTTGGLSIGSWYYVVGTFDGSVLKVYINGTLQASLSWTGSILPGTATLKIGTRGNDAIDWFFSGLIDEATVSGTARSAGWIATRYNNMYNPSTFYSVLQEVPFIDLAVTGITIDNHGCSVYRNDTYADGITPYYYAVEVTIRNLGNLTTGLFYVKLEVYWINGSLLETSAEILVSGLAGGTDTLVNFTSLFHPMQSGYYRLTATVDSRNNITETSKANNMLFLDNVPVTVVGDLNGDGVVNILDAVIMSQAWQATPGSTQWTIRADINHDGVIDILDAVRIGLYWGETS